jgi:hypothetical protein
MLLQFYNVPNYFFSDSAPKIEDGPIPAFTVLLVSILLFRVLGGMPSGDFVNFKSVAALRVPTDVSCVAFSNLLLLFNLTEALLQNSNDLVCC